MEFSGRLASFPIGDLLQWAHHDRRTGALVLRRSHTEKRVYFRNGNIVACFSDEAAEYFGQHLLVRGLVSEDALVRALSYCQQNRVPLGKALQDLSLLPRELVWEELRRHVEDQVCDLFLWRSGVFYFTVTTLPEEAELPEGISAVQIALEGSRWADQMVRIRKVFVHDQVMVRRGSILTKRPTALELRILKKADTAISLEELYAEVRGSYFRFLEAALKLAVEGALDVVDVGESEERYSTELRLTDFLIEQVTEEEALRLRSELAIPLDILKRFYPFWVGPGANGSPEAAPEELKKLIPRLDGSTALTTVLAGQPRDLERRFLEWLLEQLAQGRIGLLPVPVPPGLQAALN